MFSKIPPVTNIETNNVLNSIPIPFQIYHSTVTNESYCSMGERRKKETHCIFHYTLKGHGEVMYKGISYKINPGEGFFNIINESNSGYRYPNSSTEPWEFLVVCFNGGNTRQIVKELLEHQVVYTINNRDNFCLMCEKLLSNSNSDMVFTFFSRVLAMIHSANMSFYQNDIYTGFQKIVERDMLKNPTIATIASELQISREHLQREYFKQTGKTPAKYLNDKRFEQLCFLLTTSLSETDISDKMNFSSISGMNSFFKRYTGITLRQARKNGYFTI